MLFTAVIRHMTVRIRKNVENKTYIISKFYAIHLNPIHSTETQ